jgi:hypothetical protein
MNIRWLHAHRTLVVSLVIAMVAVGLLTALVIRQQGDQANGQVYLEAGGSVGANPFVPPVVPLKTANGVPGSGGDDGKTGDPEMLISYLVAHPQAATAWVKALNSDPSLSWSGGNRVEVQQIPAYLHELTPRSIDSDLRVTDYQFANGAALAVQSILERGTIVLVDAKGVSRVRCASGNPLAPMIPLRVRPHYRGTPWSGFQPQRVIVTQRGVQCERNDYYDSERCRRIAVCPRGEYRGDGGQCYDRDQPGRPTEGTRPGEVRRAAEGGPSSEVRRPAEGGPSSEVTRPTRSDPSGEVRQPAEGGPSDTVRKPAKEGSSGEVKQPAKSGPSDTVKKPAKEGSSGEVKQPAEGGSSGEVKKPAKSGPSDTVKKPAKEGSSGEVKKPAKSGPSDTVKKPAKDGSSDEVKQPAKGGAASGPQQPDKGAPPAQPGHADTGERAQS